MLHIKDFLQVCAEAHVHAAFFLSARNKHRIRPEEFLSDPAKAAAALEAFIQDYTGIAVVPVSLPDHFASWLVADATGSISIAIDPEHLVAWSQQTGKSVNNQRTLALIHEFAHTQITPRLLTAGVTLAAFPREEERAWAFTYAFLAVVCGEYSFQKRSTEDVDDVSKYPI